MSKFVLDIINLVILEMMVILEENDISYKLTDLEEHTEITIQNPNTPYIDQLIVSPIKLENTDKVIFNFRMRTILETGTSIEKDPVNNIYLTNLNKKIEESNGTGDKQLNLEILSLSKKALEEALLKISILYKTEMEWND